MKGIMFKEPLYNAIVRGDKTQTRRVIKVKEKGLNDIVLHGVSIHASLKGLYPSYWADISGRYDNTNSVRKPIRINPRYQIGETVYLKEPYLPDFFDKSIAREYYKGNTTSYGFDYNNTVEAQEAYPGLKFKNKMFMPEKYARRFIKITNVRVERLQDISETDILCEGVPPNVINAPDNEQTLRDTWRELWDSINKPPYAWDNNPWNWVYEFELIKK